jgi:hypothetical protein
MATRRTVVRTLLTEVPSPSHSGRIFGPAYALALPTVHAVERDRHIPVHRRLPRPNPPSNGRRTVRGGPDRADRRR